MTISATEALVSGPYNGNGVTTVFSYAQTIFAETELQVFLLSATGTETLQVLATNYTVSPTGGTFPATGGTITMLVAPPTGTQLIILPNITRSQERPFSSQSSITLQEIEDALDKLTATLRQLYERSLRAVTVSAFDPGGLDTLIGNITTLGALSTEIQTLATNIAAIQTVSTNIAAVNNVSTNMAALLLVQAALANINTVATNIANVNTVATNIANINTVVTNIAAVNTVASNMASILSALTGAVPRTSTTGAAILPAGTTGQRDGAPVAGYLRFNSTLGAFEGWDGTAWRTMSAANLASLAGLAFVAGDLIYATGAGTLARLPKGTALQKLQMNAGATAPEWADAAGPLSQTFTASGTWTKPSGYANDTLVLVELWGAGGAGGKLNAGQSNQCGGGGGGGAYLWRLFRIADLPASVAVGIGAGGVGSATAADGAAGGNSTFGSLMTAFGGGGGGGGAIAGASGLGGGGGGSLAAGTSAVGLTTNGVGGPIGGANGAGRPTTDDAGAGGMQAGAANISNAHRGGAGGGAGNSVITAGGTSVYGGNGGTSGFATTAATAGSAPGGGGGGYGTNAGGSGTLSAGSGARGECRVRILG